LLKGDSIITNEEDAKRIVFDYIFTPHATLPEGIKVERAIKLNSIFYNVFVNIAGQEKVYTVAADGKIIQTVCGV